MLSKSGLIEAEEYALRPVGLFDASFVHLTSVLSSLFVDLCAEKLGDAALGSPELTHLLFR